MKKDMGESLFQVATTGSLTLIRPLRVRTSPPFLPPETVIIEREISQGKADKGKSNVFRGQADAGESFKTENLI